MYKRQLVRQIDIIMFFSLMILIHSLFLLWRWQGLQYEAHDQSFPVVPFLAADHSTEE